MKGRAVVRYWAICGHQRARLTPMGDPVIVQPQRFRGEKCDVRTAYDRNDYHGPDHRPWGGVRHLI